MRVLLGCFMVAAISVVAAGCDDETSPAPSITVPPAPTYTAGNLSVAQRGVSVDGEDLKIFGSGIDASKLNEDFGLLVLNLPYVDNPTGCPQPEQAARVQPLAKAQALLAEARSEGLSFERLAVNVDLLTPGRRGLLHICPPVKPRFDEANHREAVLEAFRDLAGLEGLAYITVGLEMNTYYHLSVDGKSTRDDYTNYVTLYRSVYAAIKEINPEIQVGPGVNWASFMRLTVPEITELYGVAELTAAQTLQDPFLFEAVQLAARRTIWPLLFEDYQLKNATADFLGLTMIPRQNEAPFSGSPAPEDEASVLAHYRYVDVVAAGLPVVLPQIDWETQSGANANNKAVYLTVLKKALSHVEIKWAAWRRLADVPELTEGSNPCGRFTESRDPALNYTVDYCYAGMINDLGQEREVYRVLTTNP